jgi:hypothetical protein
MGGKLKSATLVAIALLAVGLCLTACGGGGSGGETATTTTNESAPRSGASGSPANAGSEKGRGGERFSAGKGARAGLSGGGENSAAETHVQERRREARERAAYERKRYGSPSPQSAPFAKYSGSSSQGKLHLAEFGSEAEEAARREVQGAIGEYLQATRAGGWALACGYLAAEARAQVNELAKSEGCGTGLTAVIRMLGKNDTLSVEPSDGIASLRIQEGGRSGEGVGFALFHGSDGGDYWMAVKRQGGEWKVLSVVPQPFVG